MNPAAQVPGRARIVAQGKEHVKNKLEQLTAVQLPLALASGGLEKKPGLSRTVKPVSLPKSFS